MICTIVAESVEPYMREGEEEQRKFVKQKLVMAILELYRQGYTEFYLNCELMVPLWAGEAVGMLKKSMDIGLHIVVPFENQCADWVEYNRNVYYALHELADTVTFASHHIQPDCYQKADRMMVDESDLLVVCGEGEEYCYAAEYARKTGVPVRFLNLL